MQVLFTDTLKLKGSLYGHKLPVLSMDISSDSTLLVTASADKNIKFWGLDFNDCHKSIFAHNDSVMQARHTVTCRVPPAKACTVPKVTLYGAFAALRSVVFEKLST